MAEPDLGLLQSMVQRVLDVQTQHTEQLHEIKQRLTTVETQAGNLSATESVHYAQTMQRLDRHERQMERIERRLDIVDA